MVVAVVIAAATMATPPATIRNPEHALAGSHCATDAGPDRAANHTADRAANPVAFRRALLRAAHDALRMPDMGDREQGDSECRGRKMKLYGQTGGHCRCSDPPLHLNSFLLGRDCTDGAEICNADAAKKLRACGEFGTRRRCPKEKIAKQP